MHCVYHFGISSFSASFPFRLLANVNLNNNNNAVILKYRVVFCSVKKECKGIQRRGKEEDEEKNLHIIDENRRTNWIQ